MTITLLQVDGDPTNGPKYTAQQFRQGQAATHGGGSGRQLGGRSGFRLGTPSTVLSATSTTWTLNACAAMIDPGASTHQGMYGWSSDANVTGAVTAADATNPRKDIVYIQVNDSSAGDGSGALTADVLYLAGTPAVDPAAPALPARSFFVGTISVPTSGGGSPSVVLNPARYVAAGAVLPVGSADERATLTPYRGLEIRRQDLTQAGASGVLERYNGANWDHFGFAEWTTLAGGIPGGTVSSVGGASAVTAKTTDSAFITLGSGAAVTARDAGIYSIEFTGKWSVAVSGRSFFSIDSAIAPAVGATVYSRASVPDGEDAGTVSARLNMSAGQTVYINAYRSAGTADLTGQLRVQRTA